MTSWPKRIINLVPVLKSLLNQTIEPDLIELNLCILEFPNKEKNFPEDLKKLIYENKKIEINWVEKNTYTFKKIIPTIEKFFGMDYYLLSVDDDLLYRNDYISIMINNIKRFNADSFSLSKIKVVGSRMIYKSLNFDRDFIEKLTDEIINLRIHDYYIQYYLKKKKKKMINYNPKDLKDIIHIFNPIYPNSNNTKNGRYSKNRVHKAHKLINKIKF